MFNYNNHMTSKKNNLKKFERIQFIEEKKEIPSKKEKSLLNGNYLTSTNNLFVNDDKNILINTKKSYKKINIIFLILHLFCFIIYIISLKRCKGGQENYCVSRFIKTFIFLGILDVINSLIVSIYLVLLIRKKISFFHLFYLFPFYLIVYIYDHGDDFNKHGEFTFQIFFIFLILFFVIINFFILLVQLIKKKKFFILFILFFILSFPIQYYIYVSTFSSCDNWDEGLNSEKIYNYLNSKCKFKNPPNCKMKYYYGKLDLSSIIGVSNYNKKSKAVKYLNKTLKKSNYLGYPYTNKIPVKNVFDNFFFHNFVPENMIDMENFQETEENKKPEVTVKFNFWGEGKVEINLQKNETLAKERKKKENKDSLYKNILLIYIDAISRSHFLLSLKNLSKFIEKFMLKNENKKENFSSFQFFKYHSLGSFTHVNVQPMFYGNSILSMKGVDFGKYGKENGYILGQSNNHCAHTLFNDEHQMGTKNVETIFYDHEFFSLYCDPNYYDKKFSSSFNRGPSSFTRRILYGKDSFQYEFEYLTQFWENYLDNRKLFRISFMDAHEDTGEVIKYLDKPLTNFLNDFYIKGYLNDTFIMFVSDHGLHFPRIYGLLAFENFNYEKTLPSLFIISGKKISDDNFILSNQNKFITAYDIHATLIHVIFGNDFQKFNVHHEKGNSLFQFINEEKRDCSLYPELPKNQCRCF